MAVPLRGTCALSLLVVNNPLKVRALDDGGRKDRNLIFGRRKVSENIRAAEEGLESAPGTPYLFSSKMKITLAVVSATSGSDGCSTDEGIMDMDLIGNHPCRSDLQRGTRQKAITNALAGV